MVSQNNYSISGVERTDLVIGLTYAVGTRAKIVTDAIEKHLSEFNYRAHIIKISHEILRAGQADSKEDNYNRIRGLMDRGNIMRKKSGDYGVLALLAVELIRSARGQEDQKLSQDSKVQEQLESEKTAGGQMEKVGLPGHAFIISSLKHPQEVEELREIYSSSFFLVAINESEDQRRTNLVDSKNIRVGDAKELIPP